MHITRRAATLLAAPIVAAGLALAGATAASAAPACTGGACTETGNVTVTATITLSVSPASFNIGNVAAGTMSTPPSGSGAGNAMWSATITTGDVNGYSLTAVAGTDWTSGANTFPASDTTLYQPSGSGVWGGSNPAPIALPEPNAAPAVTDTSLAASSPSGDVYPFAATVTVPANQRTGAYSIAVNQLAIGS